MHTTKVRALVGIAMLGAVAFIVMFLEFPILPLFPFLKLDFSDVVVLLGTFIYGPVGGIGVAVIRSLLHYIMTGAGLGSLIGDFAGVLASISYLLLFWQLFKKTTGVGQRLLPGFSATLSMTVVMALANWLFVLPLYMQLMGMQLGMSMTSYILIGLVPFNLIKGVLVAFCYRILSVQVMPVIERRVHFK